MDGGETGWEKAGGTDRGGKRYDGRGSDDARWDPKDRYHDPCQDLGDLYDEVLDSASDECVWPEFESEEEN